jgi:hypothetical protein
MRDARVAHTVCDGADVDIADEEQAAHSREAQAFLVPPVFQT